MAAGDLNIALILKLVDQVTGPARIATRSLRDIDKITGQAGRNTVAWANRQIDASNARRASLMGEALGVTAVAGSLFASLKPAIEFESAMAGVSKVLDFDTPAGLKALEHDILGLTTSEGLPMAAEGIAAIIEAAGQAGVVDKALPDDEERAQLIDFARSAAQMGVAFGISADEAGSAMAGWRAAMGLTQHRSLVLGDAINHLSNNMNASAPALVDVIRRQGAVAMTAGLAETEIAALSAAFLSGGASPEIAATALKNFTGALTDGEAMTTRQRKVIEGLGFDAETLAERMQVDARGAILDVMEALAKLPEHAQGAALSQVFGEESKGAIAPLLTNLDLLRDAFELVEDQAAFSGSMLDEYGKQAATTANALKITRNFLTGLAVTMGSIVLPELNQLLATVQPILGVVTDWAAANPELISTILKVTGGLLMFRLGSIAARWAVLSLVTPVLHLIRGLGWLMISLPRIGGFLLALGGPLKTVLSGVLLLSKAFLRLGLLMLTNPIGLVILGVAALAKAIYDNWDRIVRHVTEKVMAVKTAFDEGLVNGVFKLLSEFNPFTLATEGMQGLLAYGMDLMGVPDEIVKAFREFSLFDTGVALIRSLWDGMFSLIDTVVASVVAKFKNLKPQWLTTLQNRIGGDRDPSGRDRGGPVRAGFPYLVGERSPEIFIPGLSGTILPTRVLKSAMAASVIALPVAASEAELEARFDRRPVLSAMNGPAMAPGPQVHRGGDTITINIYPAPGMSPEEIGREVARQLARRDADRRGDLHDGLDY